MLINLITDYDWQNDIQNIGVNCGFNMLSVWKIDCIKLKSWST